MESTRTIRSQEMRQPTLYPGQHGWRCPKCGKLEKALNVGLNDDRMIQKVIDHVCSKPKWWRFWETKIAIVWRQEMKCPVPNCGGSLLPDYDHLPGPRLSQKKVLKCILCGYVPDKVKV